MEQECIAVVRSGQIFGKFLVWLHFAKGLKVRER
jgi:hypothetical protein